ncbi:50S ribosomal protein L25/general stress protein Ctc [Lyngbya aestuarii]|uniref:50S ribosomal protein L25/general stress protein Ctc n=1 Tax=Lyngbya aestuarii TaxID=118322 RepID=UPI00403E071B
MEVTVECQKRPEGSKPKALRRSGKIPAVLYGHQGTESVSLTVNAKTAETLLKQVDVNLTPIQVSIPDLPWSGKAILREVQAHPWKGKQLYHLSFFSLASQDSLQVVVPLHLVGEAVGVKEGGVLEQVMTEVQVQCAPDNIPESIEIDISNMELGSSLHLHELVVPENLTVMDDLERTVISLAAPPVIAAEPTEQQESAMSAEPTEEKD